MDGWRNIESAPKNGTRVLLGFEYLQNFDIVAHFMKGSWRISGMKKFYGRPKPTHWMPLSIAPGLEGAKYAK